MQIVIIGAGPAGLFLGSALAGRGHRVTAVDRDPGPSDDATWARRGVMQFHHAHAFRQTVVEAVGREVPDGARPVARRGGRADRVRGLRRRGHPARAAVTPRDLRARTAHGRPGETRVHPASRSRRVGRRRGRPGRRRRRGRRTDGRRPGDRRLGARGAGHPWSGGASRGRRTVRSGLRRPGLPAATRGGAGADDQPDRLAGRARRLPLARLPTREGPVLRAHRAASRRRGAARAAARRRLRGRRPGDPGPRCLDRPGARRAGHRRAGRRCAAQRVPEPVRRERRAGPARPLPRRRQRRHHDARLRPWHHHHPVAVRGSAEPARPRRGRPGRRGPCLRRLEPGHDAALGRGPHPHGRRPRGPVERRGHRRRRTAALRPDPHRR